MHRENRLDLAHDLVVPTILFVVLGAMTWAVRGCSGFGAMNGCIFAGVTWGAGWWFIAREPGARQSRPYASGWVILALTLGIGVAGNRGWMQWPSFWEGHLQTDSPHGAYLPIPRAYGYLWLFVAGVPWAGLGACALAWCGTHRKTGAIGWVIRLACAFGGAWLATVLFKHLPDVFLPLYKSYSAQYHDLHANPNLRRLMGDNRAAIMHLGFFLGCLAFEVGRGDWRNATLITTVGVVNGAGWALFQNWSWAHHVWPNFSFNWWRCWESSGGISIGLAYGLAYFLTNRRVAPPEGAPEAPALFTPDPNCERLGAYIGLVIGLGLSIKNGLKGWANIYIGNEEHWNHVLWTVIGPLMLVALIALPVWIYWRRPMPAPAGAGPAGAAEGDPFPHAYGLIWLVLIVQNVIAQLITGPHSSWDETVFSFYYILLFLISAVIVHHYHCLQRLGRA